ncbi:MAG: hypothetical protein F6K24_33335 [Okeania sp. SIO2D1]|nr:hypothetical protein [Okeania sp. SIO2D1]
MVIINPISTEKQVLELKVNIVQIRDKLFLRNAEQTRSTFDTLYYPRQIEPEKMPMVHLAHVEGSSLRGITRTVNLADNTVVSLVSSSFSKRAND